MLLFLLQIWQCISTAINVAFVHFTVCFCLVFSVAFADIHTCLSLTKVLVIDKKEFVESEQTNALSAYRKRVQTLKEQVQKIEQYDTMFRQKLKEEAEREKVFSI